MRPWEQGTNVRDASMAKVIPLEAHRGREEPLDELLAAVQAGQRPAQARLYDRFADSVNRHVWRLLGGDPEHDDIVQNIFLAVFRRIHTVETARALPAWIRTITVFEVRTQLRKRTVFRRFFSRSDPDAADRATAAYGDPETAELLSRMRRVLEAMNSDDRLCFVMRHVEQREVGEIADLLGWSRSTTRRRLKRAQERFRARVERDPHLRELGAEGSA